MSPTVLIKSKFEQLSQNASKKETLYVTFYDIAEGIETDSDLLRGRDTSRKNAKSKNWKRLWN